MKRLDNFINEKLSLNANTNFVIDDEYFYSATHTYGTFEEFETLLYDMSIPQNIYKLFKASLTNDNPIYVWEYGDTDISSDDFKNLLIDIRNKYHIDVRNVTVDVETVGKEIYAAAIKDKNTAYVECYIQFHKQHQNFFILQVK